ALADVRPPRGHRRRGGALPGGAQSGSRTPIDVVNDFEPVALLVSNYLTIVAKKSLPAKNLTELIAWPKADPDKAAAGTAGAGGIFHLAGIPSQKITGTRFQFVPYRGIAPALQDLVAGRIDLIFADTSAIPQVRAGKHQGIRHHDYTNYRHAFVVAEAYASS